MSLTLIIIIIYFSMCVCVWISQNISFFGIIFTPPTLDRFCPGKKNIQNKRISKKPTKQLHKCKIKAL